MVRRDSPNGKRYARKGHDGGIEQAFGFDLTPLLARAQEFERMAETVRAERRSLRFARERITVLRRDIGKMIAFGLEEGIAADWQRLHLDYREVVGRLPRTASRFELEPVVAALASLAEEIRKILETNVETQNLNGNESHFERHKKNSKTDSSEYEPRSEKEQGMMSMFPLKPRAGRRRDIRLDLFFELAPTLPTTPAVGFQAGRS